MRSFNQAYASMTSLLDRIQKDLESMKRPAKRFQSVSDIDKLDAKMRALFERIERMAAQPEADENGTFHRTS